MFTTSHTQYGLSALKPSEGKPMTLCDADRMTRPIWESIQLRNNAELQSLLQRIRDLIPEGGYIMKNPFKLNQLEILDDDLAAAFTAFVQKYESLVTTE